MENAERLGPIWLDSRESIGKQSLWILIGNLHTGPAICWDQRHLIFMLFLLIITHRPHHPHPPPPPPPHYEHLIFILLLLLLPSSSSSSSSASPYSTALKHSSCCGSPIVSTCSTSNSTLAGLAKRALKLSNGIQPSRFLRRSLKA